MRNHRFSLRQRCLSFGAADFTLGFPGISRRLMSEAFVIRLRGPAYWPHGPLAECRRVFRKKSFNRAFAACGPFESD